MSIKTIAKNIVRRIVKDTHFYEEWVEKRTNEQNARRLSQLKVEEENNRKLYVQPPVHVVNLNANDICNSKCAMCNIWEQKQGFEMSPGQLNTVLKDQLFSQVKHIGITGGEPTLREDLPQLYEAAIDAIPGIQGLSIITNAIKEKDVISRINKVIEVCKRRGKSFSMMVSLDGYGKTHDRVRGREGNFQSAINVINHFKNKNIPIATGCTISKVNVWEVDELLDYIRENEIYGRFRIAEFIKRLYNDNKADVIRNFDEDEVYHLILFFYKLIFNFEKDETYKRTYKSIINILSGGKRLIGCPYHQYGVVLNSRAELAYCAPKSKIVGDALNQSALGLYKDNIAERNRIMDSDCDYCIHDYHSPITYKELKKELDEQTWQRNIHLNSRNFNRMYQSVAAINAAKTKVFITGWYGTETVGDKAILAGIIQELKASYGDELDIVISSLYPLITERTLKELDIAAKVVSVYSEEFVAHAKGSDMVIMGGGPLMDLDVLALPLIAFKIAKQSKGKAIVYGCGLGPLTEEKYVSAVKEILNLADDIKLRDEKSVAMAKKWLKKKVPVSLSGDPAKKYLQKFIEEASQPKPKNVLRCFLREWTYEYSRDLSYDEFLEEKEKFESSLAQFIKQKAAAIGAGEIVLEHMHNFVVGNDDRDFSRHFIKTYFNGDNKIPISYNKYLSTVDSIVYAMQASSHNICMRFHSVLFAHTLNTSFTAIDYTKGGKIFNYLTDNSSVEKMVTVSDLIKNFNGI